jgi:trehalose synthase-fused probable maltokinase
VNHLEPAWLQSQRWFRSKQRPIDAVNEADRAIVSERAALVVVDVMYRDGEEDERYLVPLVDDREPRDGDGAWWALADLIASGATMSGGRGRFEATALATTDGGNPLGERRLRVEQSNTSVVLGERLILKLYRLLEEGENPDVEVSAFLTGAGFGDTPAVAGSLVYVDAAGTRSSAAMLQAFVPSRGDAWGAMLTLVATDPAAATQMAVEVGDLTRRLHAALASRPDAPDFPYRPASAAELSFWRASAEHQFELAIQATRGDDRAQLVARLPVVRQLFETGFASAGPTPVSRVHGDYHLGQLLARDDGAYSVIDFEGEPARALEERRRPASPLRDVAGMLRSLDYAARTANASSDWLATARAGFIEGYGGIGDNEQALVDAFELEKACYEIRYEASNRPAWLWLPLAAVARLTRPD